MDGLRPAPPELEAVVKELMVKEFPHLLTKRFVLAVRDVALQTPEGQSTVAAVGISTDPDDSFDYILWFAWDVWQTLTSNQREAIVFHEFMHCDRSKADSTGLRPHDASVFDEEVKRYGVWWESPASQYANQDANQDVNWNSVNWNSVNWNNEDFRRVIIGAVNWNSVNWNSVNWNSVNWNSEDFRNFVIAVVNWNSVNWNSVNWNSVNWNSVNWNSVNWNSEEFRNQVMMAVNWNSVNWNSVNWNSVNWNSEAFQKIVIATVNWNSVNWNSVNWNSVNWNSANWNSVNWNSVNWNSVNWNSVNWNSVNRLLFDEEKSLNKEKSLEKTAIKREHGIDFPPRDYALVPDPNRPSTWRLRLTEAPGKVTEMQLRKAAAALSPTGFRGNRVEIPTTTLASVKRRLRAEFRRLKIDEGRIPSSVKDVAEEEFMVWKDVETGLMRWFAIYSNNFRDSDHPSEIISEKSHQTYVELVDEEIIDFPELWLWHTKGTAWGKADWVAYSDGFAMASGLVHPGKEYIAKNLMKRGNLRVSHGMIKPLLVYDPHDKSVILFHVTHEISPLPDWAAANSLTGFTILDEGELTMALPANKMSFLKEAGLDDEALQELNANLTKARTLATESGLESKDADAEIDEFDQGDLEAPADEEETEEGVVAVAKAKETAKPKAKVAKKKEVEVPALEFATRQEVVEAITAVGQILTASMQTIQGLAGQVETLTKEITALKAEDADKIAATKELTPRLSLADIISQNIIGKDASRVDGRTVIGKDGPRETPMPEAQPATMVPFVNDLIGKSVELARPN